MRERTQINKIRNEEGEVKRDTPEIQSILRQNHKTKPKQTYKYSMNWAH